MAQANIKLELFKSGIHLTCEETGHDEFIQSGDGNRLIELINEIDEATDPDVIYSITDKGKEILNIMEEEGLEFIDACNEYDNRHSK